MRRVGMITIAAAAAASLLLAACGDGEETATGSASESTADESTAPAGDENSGTITDIVAGTPEFSTLLTAVEAAGLAETLSGPGPFTVFAPTDAAFAQLPDGTLNALVQPENKDQLTGVLTYHVLPDEVMASEVTAGEVTTVNGAALTASVEGGSVTLTDGQGNQAKVIKTDIAAANGVIHVIDAVLLPGEA